MSTLHVINKANALPACLSVAGAHDALLLIEDGVYAGTTARSPQRPLYALAADVDARGLNERLGPSVTVISDAEFVQLAVDHQPIVSWR